MYNTILLFNHKMIFNRIFNLLSHKPLFRNSDNSDFIENDVLRVLPDRSYVVDTYGDVDIHACLHF